MSEGKKYQKPKDAAPKILADEIIKIIVVCTICVIMLAFSFGFIIETLLSRDRYLKPEDAYVLASLGGSIAVQYYFAKSRRPKR